MWSVQYYSNHRFHDITPMDLWITQFREELEMSAGALSVPMSRAQLATFMPRFGLPYTADSMRAPLRELGVEPLFERAVPGTKTTRVAHYDPIVAWLLALSFTTPRSWRPRTKTEPAISPPASLRDCYEEFERRAQDMALADFAPGSSPENPVHTWKRIASWRLLVDRDSGLDLRVLDRIVSGFPESTSFDMSGRGVLKALMERYKQETLQSFGTQLGAGDGILFDSWALVDEVLAATHVVLPQQRQDEVELVKVQRRT